MSSGLLLPFSPRATPGELLERVLHSSGAPPLLERTLCGPLRSFLARPGKGLRAELVTVAWELAAGRGEVPAEILVAIELLHAGSLVVDDIEDGSCERRGAPALHARIGVPLALNAGNWLYFAALELLASTPVEPASRLRLLETAGSLLARCHQGQALDLGIAVSELSQDEVPAAWRASAERKTGGLSALAASLSAVSAGAGQREQAALRRFGERLGVALQLLDDVGSVCSEARRCKGQEDVALGRVTACWALLSSRLPAESYELLRVWSAEVVADRAEPGPLLDKLRASLADHGKDAARHELDEALHDLRRAFPPSRALDRAADLARCLESHYG